MRNFTFSSAVSVYYSPEQLFSIQKSKIGIAGAGGLGSNCACILARCGFERFVIADFDTVSPSNLNRQVYIPSHIGRPKVECLKEVLLSINPSISVDTFQCRIDRVNIHVQFHSCDVLIEAFDDAQYKAMLAQEFISSDKLIVCASGIGGYGNSDRIVTRKIKDNFFVVGDGVTEVNDKMRPYAPQVLIAAAKQADIVLSWVISR